MQSILSNLNAPSLLMLIASLSWINPPVSAQESPPAGPRLKQVTAEAPDSEATQPGPASSTLEELKSKGALHSSYRQRQRQLVAAETPQPRIDVFKREVEPVLKQACVHCHGPDAQEGNIRIDTLDPDLLHGDDVAWWLEISAVLSKGEMPPADEPPLPGESRSRIIEWLSSEIQVASAVRRAGQGHSSFRRMTRYEYKYALQDLLGLPFDFARDLPPESTSEDGFQNSSENLHMSAVQFATYRESSREALSRAIHVGEQPAPLFWGVSMEAASAESWASQDKELDKIRQQHKDDPDALERELQRQRAKFRVRPNATHYRNPEGQTARAGWSYGGARYAWKPSPVRPEVPPVSNYVALIPPRQKLIVELGNQVPDQGTLRVRVRASQVVADQDRQPSLQLEFGWQASNDSAASVRISNQDLAIDAPPDQPRFYEWNIPLSEIYPRNSVRKTGTMGETPSPSEFIKLVNSSVSQGDIQIDYVEVSAPVYEQWPPASHTRIFFDSANSDSANQSNEATYAREVLIRFMSRAWRRPVTDAEVDQKLALFSQIRPVCDNFHEAMVEVLATVLASPHFLYLVRSEHSGDEAAGTTGQVMLDDSELATRLSMFLWCSTPDDELLDLAARGQLRNPEVLDGQIDRMLADERSRRFAEHFVRQWLGMQLLDYLDVDRKTYPRFDSTLKEAMQEEPTAFFREVLRNNHSVLDFLHADYTMANERLAQHYGLSNVHGNHFRRVLLDADQRRGGLLTQAGLLAMNSDGTDSHPLKRGIWMLERLLNDPPPPPPPAVPRIDLADPEIAKLTLKQRIEDHRNQAACMSCHAKIDPWGIAFENFDAVGAWRTQIKGQPVDATSLLFNRQRLDGIDGLKRFLLTNRQDQFVRALVHKMTTYALGRPLTFGDRSSVDGITADLRQQGDGLATMIRLIATSELFQAK